MVSTSQCLASLVRLSLSPSSRRPIASTIPKFLVPSVATPLVRHASGGGGGGMKKKAPKKKKKTYKTFRSYDLTPVQQFSLCDAMRYIRAFEVGRPPSDVKYEVHVKLKAGRGGPVVRNRIRFPYAVKTDTRIGVICPDDSPLKAEAQRLGAVVAGQESLFESIKAGQINFNKLICHESSEEALKKANVGKVLGPRGLMPNRRLGTITDDIEKTMRDMVGSDEYRERDGVVRLAIGQLGFTPQMLADNLKAAMDKMKRDMHIIVEQGHPKAIDEVVLGSTHGPSFSLNGNFNPTEEGLEVKDLELPM